MAYNTRSIITDVNGKAVPQFYNPKTDRYEVITGRDGSNMFVALGTISAESWTGSTSEVKMLGGERYGFSIVNDGEGDITFTINGNSRLVKAYEVYNGLFEPFNSVNIVANSTYRAEVLK